MEIKKQQGTGKSALINKRDIEKAFTLLKRPVLELVHLANNIRKKEIGTKLDLCSIINAKSGLCSEDCKFCAQSLRHRCNVKTYPLKGIDEIVKSAERAKRIGADRFGIVTSGHRLNKYEIDIISRAIKKINRVIDISVCASLGSLKREELLLLKESGLDRYHHNIETSPDFYPKIVTTHTFDDRIRTINSAKAVGLETCSGGIIGMGESWKDRIKMAMVLKKLDVDSVPINMLIPIKGTPFGKFPSILPADAIRTICLFRIILRDKSIKIAAGRESILKEYQVMGFMAGANGMLIGGYLTVKGVSPEEDYKLIDEVKGLWKS